MGFLEAILNSFIANFNNEEIKTSVLITVLLMVLVLSVYEFLVYQVVLHRALYNKAFNISIAVLPFFISTIILCLQSNLVITLGTIGALAIIRFRTAVKDPVDLIFVLWAIHIGITCGCQLYEMSVITSIFATVVLIIFNKINIGLKSHILVVHTANIGYEASLEEVINKNVKKYRIKSRNYTEKGMDYVIEIMGKNLVQLSIDLEKENGIEKFSIMEYDADDIL